MPLKKTSFLTMLSFDVRRRHEHIRSGNQVTAFAVQIEILAAGQWHAVVRYDTAHGFAHRDQMHPDGRVDKTPLFLQTLNEALDFAEAELKANWQSYRDHYVKEMQP